MKLLKPSWVNHEDKPIFSVDIHPSGKRFATGGQGGDSGRVVVWNLNPVLFEAIELDPNVPKMLCQMDNHLACVNCVRWSNNGRFLASGGDDRLVMVWALSSAVPGLKAKGETWRCVSTLRGHAGDVLDLAWSPLDKWLASCSVDNTIIIWNAEKFPEMVSVLNGHTGLVKGVAWDPVGKYLASQSDDKSLRVWKTADWAQESCITEPFEECGGTTHVLRLSWSPDGQYVVSAHAMNGGGPTAQVLERDGWRCDKDFVGHRKAVTCARFNSNILVKDGKKCCCAAVGARDRALSIWLTSLKRPLVVVHDLFADSVLDLSWSCDGLNLLACSSDGSVACIQFTNQEIGTPLTIDEKNAFYEKIYGKCLPNSASGAELSGSALLLECPEIILARERRERETIISDNSQSKPFAPSLNNSASQEASSLPNVRPVDRQIETRTSDGKRRITPVFIPLSLADPNDSLCSTGGGAVPASCFSTSSQSKSRILVERRDDIVTRPNVSCLNATPANTSVNKTTEPPTSPRLRKRGASTLPGPSATAPPPRAPPAPAPPPALAPPRLGAAGPVVRAAGGYRVQVVNAACSTAAGALSRLQLLHNNSADTQPVWETYLGSAVSCIACSARWVCVSCADSSLHAWALRAGRAARALPPLALSSKAAKLSLSGDSLVAVTTAADLVAWDLSSATCLVKPISFRNLLGHGVSVTNCTLLEDGNPMITLSNCKSYIYCNKLCTWVVWLDAGDPVWRASGGAAAVRAPRASRLYPPENMPPRGAVVRGSYSALAARSWLEAQASAARQLRLARDYRHWSLALVDHLAQHGTEDQLRSILDEMLGPSHCTSTPKKWQSTVLGISKRELLAEMLRALLPAPRWQRLYCEYSDQLLTDSH